MALAFGVADARRRRIPDPVCRPPGWVCGVASTRLHRPDRRGLHARRCADADPILRFGAGEAAPAANRRHAGRRKPSAEREAPRRDGDPGFAALTITGTNRRTGRPGEIHRRALPRSWSRGAIDVSVSFTDMGGDSLKAFSICPRSSTASASTSDRRHLHLFDRARTERARPRATGEPEDAGRHHRCRRPLPVTDRAAALAKVGREIWDARVARFNAHLDAMGGPRVTRAGGRDG